MLFYKNNIFAILNELHQISNLLFKLLYIIAINILFAILIIVKDKYC